MAVKLGPLKTKLLLKQGDFFFFFLDYCQMFDDRGLPFKENIFATKANVNFFVSKEIRNFSKFSTDMKMKTISSGNF